MGRADRFPPVRALARSRRGGDGTTPAAISAMMAAGSSERGLSEVSQRAIRRASPAIRPHDRALGAVPVAPAPKTTPSRPGVRAGGRFAALARAHRGAGVVDHDQKSWPASTCSNRPGTRGHGGQRARRWPPASEPERRRRHRPRPAGSSTLCSPIERGEAIRRARPGIAATSRMPPRPDSRCERPDRVARAPARTSVRAPGSVAAHSGPGRVIGVEHDVAPGLRSGRQELWRRAGACGRRTSHIDAVEVEVVLG